MYVLKNVTDTKIFCHQLVHKFGDLMDTIIPSGGEVTREEPWAFDGGVTPSLVRKGKLVIEERNEKKKEWKVEKKPAEQSSAPKATPEKKKNKNSPKRAS